MGAGCAVGSGEVMPGSPETRGGDLEHFWSTSHQIPHRRDAEKNWKDMMLGEWEMEGQSSIKAAATQVIRVRRRLLGAVGQLEFPGKLVDAIQPGVAVHADRALGKTKA